MNNTNNETIWFAHDCNDGAEPALRSMFRKYGLWGYGGWWRIIEALRLSKDYKYNISETFAYDSLSMMMMVTEDEARQFVAQLINTYHLLQADDEYIWSPWLNERMEKMEKRKKALSEAGKKGNVVKREMKNALKQQGEDKAPAFYTQGESDANTCQPPNYAHNITQQNTTEHNNDPKPLKGLQPATGNKEIEINSLNHPQHEPVQTVPPPSVPGNTGTKFPLQSPEAFREAEGVSTFEAHRTSALADERFVMPAVSGAGITTGQLAQWLTLFNRKLHFENAPAKNEQDYRRHFRNWLKFQDTTTPNPEALPLVPAKQPPPRSSPAYLKTPAQVQAEQQQQLEDLRARTAAYARRMGIDPAQAQPLHTKK